MLTSYPDDEAVLSAIVAGASGYLLKQIRARDLVAALETVGRGESLLDPAVTEKVLDRIRRIASGAYHDELSQLTGQEQKILMLVAEGKTNKDRGRGLPVGQDGQELRQLDPLEAQSRAPRPGRGLRRQAPGRPPLLLTLAAAQTLRERSSRRRVRRGRTPRLHGPSDPT
jgi:CheY-like chemotaxis protein